MFRMVQETRLAVYLSVGPVSLESSSISLRLDIHQAYFDGKRKGRIHVPRRTLQIGTHD